MVLFSSRIHALNAQTPNQYGGTLVLLSLAPPGNILGWRRINPERPIKNAMAYRY